MGLSKGWLFLVLCCCFLGRDEGLLNFGYRWNVGERLQKQTRVPILALQNIHFYSDMICGKLLHFMRFCLLKLEEILTELPLLANDCEAGPSTAAGTQQGPWPLLLLCLPTLRKCFLSGCHRLWAPGHCNSHGTPLYCYGCRVSPRMLNRDKSKYLLMSVGKWVRACQWGHPKQSGRKVTPPVSCNAASSQLGCVLFFLIL